MVYWEVVHKRWTIPIMSDEKMHWLLFELEAERVEYEAEPVRQTR